MNHTLKIAAALLALAAAQQAAAQGGHADVQFRYDGGQVLVQTSSGSGVATGVFPTSGLFQQFTANPGFNSEIDAGLGVNGGDIVFYHVLDNLRFWDGSAFADAAADVQLRVENNLGADTLVDSASGPQPGGAAPAVNFIGQASGSGDFHSHVSYALESTTGTPATGAYGFELSLATDAAGVADSDPFFLLFNFGLDETGFGDAIDAFAGLLTGPAAPGDFNGDGQVDAADYTVWRDNLGAVETPATLSGNGDGGLVGASDYQLWTNHFGAASAAPSALPSGAPEPATITLAAALLAWRPRRPARTPKTSPT